MPAGYRRSSCERRRANPRFACFFAMLIAMSCAVVVTGCGDGTPPPAQDTAATVAAPARTRITETGPLKIDRIFHSMQGPYDRIAVDVSDLDWVTSLRTEVVDASTGEKLGDEFFCHSQLQQRNATRLMVTATGSEEIHFPPD